jgi:hypothetical protein
MTQSVTLAPSINALRRDATSAPQLKSAIDSVIKSIALSVALWPQRRLLRLPQAAK